ncbi:DUF1150 family protein [Pararhodospirillum oryzae]|uniref:DUF1150 domain-containing protein n=1 Tax=Pararhodospirillum oryzae TaxID=478448 RepID=A0A512H644_9PROT|nr:DUF1150 family protein [Pararhodospirillum oryzae]GEO80912.1 hypothetical protein ROR02_10430 [Pararhodospirillum oryzae]
MDTAKDRSLADLAPTPVDVTELAALGLNVVAYVRDLDPATEPALPGMQPGGFAIHAANGQRIGWAPSRDLAVQAIRQHEMEPVAIH